MINKKTIFLLVALVIVLIGAFILVKKDFFSSNFSTKTLGLPEAKDTEIVELKDGDRYELVMDFVTKEINGKQIRMMAYNGMIPGPTIKVKQGAEITINLKNNTDIGTALHSHGVRLDSKYDGVVGLDQKEINPGESFEYKIKFPDAGIFWYHPHVREDYAQELGLYGNYIVDSVDPLYLSLVNKKEIVTLDDILLNEDGVPEFSKSDVNYALMGRYGNVMLVNAKTDYSLSLNTGDIVRFYFTNTANARPFKISIPGAKMKLVAGDQGKYERESYISDFTISPSERVVVDVYFGEPGEYKLMNINPQKSYNLGTITVTSAPSDKFFGNQFNTLRTNMDVVNDIDMYRPYFNKAPDKKMRLSINMGGSSESNGGMHHMPDGSMMSNDGMAMPSVSLDGIEWEDTMPAMNKAMNATTEWQIIDEETGKKNMDINWVFKKGDKVKIEIYNDESGMHPMQHPIHFHGQRFLVLSTDGIKNTNLVWKDTTLVKVGSKIEILLDASNPGNWMGHCHIAEHLEASMMFMFDVES